MRIRLCVLEIYILLINECGTEAIELIFCRKVSIDTDVKPKKTKKKGKKIRLNYYLEFNEKISLGFNNII